MEEERLLIAIIAALSALLGTLIPTVIGYLDNKRQREFELERNLLNEQKDIYLELLIALQGMVNKQSDEQFLELQNARIKISIFGDDETSEAFNAYYNNVIRSAYVPDKTR